MKLSGSLHDAPDGRLRAVVQATVAPGYHINAHRPRADYLVATVLQLTGAGVSFGEPTYPEPEDRPFAFTGGEKLLVYDGAVEMTATGDGRPQGPVEAALRYQACDQERCLAPASARVVLADRRASASGAVAPESGARPGPDLATSQRPPGDGDGSWLSRWLEGASLPLSLLAVLALGLTLNLTPCVYPLVSVTVGYFGAQTRLRSRPWPLAATYVAGIVLSFAALGVTAAAFGGLFGGALQRPWVLIAIAVLLSALAASSFGWIEFRVPHALMNRFGRSSSGFVGAFAMGLSMGVVAAPCIGPIVVGLLVYVGSHGDLLRGFLLFAALGLGMGLPYFALAVTAGSISRLPRAGEWLGWVERLFGVLLLYMALHFVGPLLGPDVQRLTSFLFVAVAATYLGFVERSARSLRGFTWVRRALAVGVLVWLGWSSLPGGATGPGIAWQPLSVASLDRAIEERKPAVVEFGADWCLPCRALAATTFVDRDVTRLARGFSMLSADVTLETPENAQLLQRFGIAGVPTILFYDPSGQEIDRVVGYVGPAEFAARLRRIEPGADAVPPGDRVAGNPARGEPDHLSRPD